MAGEVTYDRAEVAQRVFIELHLELNRAIVSVAVMRLECREHY